MVSEGRKSLTVLQRSRFDIMANVLTAALSRRTKTYLMRKCNLSYRQLQAYLGLLCERGLLRTESHKGKSNPGKTFVTTEKGKAFLRAYGNLRSTMDGGVLKFRFNKVRT